MKLLQNILAAVDLGDSSERVIDQSVYLAKQFNSQITLLHVMPEEPISEEFKRYIEENIHKRLSGLADRISSEGIRIKDIIIQKGVPFEKIIQEGQINEYNVIISGSGNKSTKDSFQLGTTVEKLIRKNQIPLWVVKPEGKTEIKRIVCPVDFSDASFRAISNAITLTERFGAELHILNVYSPVNVYSPLIKVDNVEENRLLKENRDKELADFLRNFDLKVIKHKINLIRGEPYIEILKYIKKQDIDLLIMGTTGKTILSRLLMGSVTEKVTRELPCNFITTKARDITNNFFESNLDSIESILNSAKENFYNKNYDQALDKYTIALKQYPDNIPMILGIIETYEALGNLGKADFYREYGKEVIKRIWGDRFLTLFKFE